MPDSRKIDDLMGSGELDRSRSRSGDLWPAIMRNVLAISFGSMGEVIQTDLAVSDDELLVVRERVYSGSSTNSIREKVISRPNAHNASIM